MNHKQKHTKIIATFGPACEKDTVLKEMFENGVDIIRLNASHSSDPDVLKPVVKKIRKIAKKTEKKVGIFIDLQGPKIRLGKIKNNEAMLDDGATVEIVTKKTLGTSSVLQVDYKHFLKDVKENDPVFIDDGKIKLNVESVSSDKAICSVTNGGVVKNNKGVNLPRTKLSMSAFTDKDKQDALLAIKLKLDYVALSFVSTADDIIKFRQFLNENGGEALNIISKVERQQALDNLASIIEESDAVMVARGDLGVEIGVEKVPRIQKLIIRECNKHIKTVIVATQMLESMIHSNIATRAEVSDVANAILDHSDAIMLSAETAVGVSPAHVVKVMSEICEETDQHLIDMRKDADVIRKKIFETDTTATSFCRAADQIAEENNAKAIMAFTSSGNTPLIASKLNSIFQIIAPTDDERVCNQMSLYRGVTPIMMPKAFADIHRWTDMIHLAVKRSKELNLLEKGDTIVVTAGIPIGRSNGINSIRIVTI